MTSSAQAQNSPPERERHQELQRSHNPLELDEAGTGIDDDLSQAAQDALLDTTAINGDTARMLRTLLGNLDGVVYRCRDEASWILEFISEGCQRLTGFEPGHLLLDGRAPYESITHPEDRERVCEEIQSGLAMAQRFDVEYRFVHAGGEIRWAWERGAGIYDAQGNLVAIEGLIQDITERKLSSHALREAERRYYNLFENALEGIFRTTAEGQYLDANPALARIYGFSSPAELISSLKDISSQLYIEPQRREQFMRLIRKTGMVSGFESQIRRKNGEVIWISENARAVVDDDGSLICYEGTVEDITEHKLYQAHIEQKANYDTLTGLANRSLLHERLHQAILAAASVGSRLAVVFVDVDRFKVINDSLGHPVGDELLRAIAQRLRANVRESDTVARFGGDEFVLLINGQSDPESVATVLERMLADISQPWRIPQGDFDVSCSIGVALYPDDGDRVDVLLKHADAAMYRAKSRGRNNFQFFTAEVNELVTQRLDLESRLRRALQKQQFLLHYQPRVDMRTRQIVGMEALARWQMPDHPPVPPARFIPVAEEIGLAQSIGAWVLRTACLQNKRWQDAGLPPLVISVNVSARQFRHDSFVQGVKDVLQETGLPARFLEIELTENAVMRDAEQFAATLSEVKSLGVRISLDDFGTGFSSLQHMKHLPVDRLKIDSSFVQNLASPEDASMVRAIISLGHHLGLKVVAEGVETAEQMEFLRQHDCDEAQGYYLALPREAGEVEKYLK